MIWFSRAWLAGFVILTSVLLRAADAEAARFVVVLSSQSEPYLDLFDAIRQDVVPRGHDVRWMSPATLSSVKPGEVRLVVSVGVDAAERAAALPWRVPVLAVLVPRQWYLASGFAMLSDGGRRQVSAIFLDQPPARQAALIKLAFPGVERVGVVVSAAQSALLGDYALALRRENLQLVGEIVAPGAAFIGPLENVLAKSELLLALPDPQVLNSRTVQSLLLTSYRYRDPVLGYSRSLTTAGALLSLHSSPYELGRQAAEWLNVIGDSPVVRLPTASYPRYFGVTVNVQVARSLGLRLPSAEQLAAQLERLP